MQPDSVVLLGLKNQVIALQRDTGRRLWSRTLGGGLGEGFVSLISDGQKVFAHAKGELFCLDLFTGAELWRDELSGMGYGVASLALPGGAATQPELEHRRRQEAQRANRASNGHSVGH